MLRRLLLPLLLLLATIAGCQREEKELIVGRWSHKRLSLIIEEGGRVFYRTEDDHAVGIWQYNATMNPPVLTLKMISDYRPDEVMMVYYEVEFLVDDRIRITRFNPENHTSAKPGEIPDRFVILKRGEETDSQDKQAVAGKNEKLTR